MARTTMHIGPFKGESVEVYEGTNPHKIGTVFAPRIGMRLNAETGELSSGSVFQGEAAVNMGTIVAEPVAEPVVADTSSTPPVEPPSEGSDDSKTVEASKPETTPRSSDTGRRG